MEGSVWTIVVAGGGGRRFGRTPEGASKQFVELAGRRVLDHSVDAARSVSTGVVVVVPADQIAVAVPGADHVVAGGETRADSVRAGLACVPDDAAIVLVHDAARPAADTDLFARVVAAVRAGADGAVPVLDVTDTLRGRHGGVIDRSELVVAQTPQGFAAAVLRQAHTSGGDATDDASLVEAIGGTIEHVDGEPTNRKLTHPGDEVLLAAVLDPRARGESATRTGRVGMGFDQHPVSDDPNRTMVLGGVHFDGPGLAGHSDSDVIAHACTDALLGAAGLGDIGSRFPDTDPALVGADSIELLRSVGDELRAGGWRVANVDCAVVCDRPKIAPRRDEMQAALSAAAGGPVTVKGKRTEGIGALGRGEGIACWAVALIERDEES